MAAGDHTANYLDYDQTAKFSLSLTLSCRAIPHSWFFWERALFPFVQACMLFFIVHACGNHSARRISTNRIRL